MGPRRFPIEEFQVKPTVLLVTTKNWVPTARLGAALANAGFQLEALCPPRHPIGHTKAALRTHTYRGLRPLASIWRAISAARPDLIVPGDDLAARHLHDLHRQQRLNPELPNRGFDVATVIERSLGSPETFAILDTRAAFLEVAREEGIRVPESAVLKSGEDVSAWVARAGLPTVLKSDGSSGGEGVRIAGTAEQAQRAFRSLRAAPLLARALKRALLDQDRTLIWPSLLRQRPAVSAQAHVAGQEATSTIACWQGRVLAGLHFEVLRKSNSAGHATVVRRIEHPEISAAVEKIVRRLRLSGLCGFDFMLEAGTGNAYLIEINPRATQVGHITLGPGADLPAALYGAITDQATRISHAVTTHETIALFPHEWARDPSSEFLRAAYHDVPWEMPELVHACIRRGREQSAWYARAERDHEVAAPAGDEVPAETSSATAVAKRLPAQ